MPHPQGLQCHISHINSQRTGAEYVWEIPTNFHMQCRFEDNHISNGKQNKPLLSGLISPKQMGFVEGKQILDGIILTHEIIHSLKQTKTSRMLIKVDIAKAYDKVNWMFLKEVLKSFGFKHD